MSKTLLANFSTASEWLGYSEDYISVPLTDELRKVIELGARLLQESNKAFDYIQSFNYSPTWYSSDTQLGSAEGQVRIDPCKLTVYLNPLNPLRDGTERVEFWWEANPQWDDVELLTQRIPLSVFDDERVVVDIREYIVDDVEEDDD